MVEYLTFLLTICFIKPKHLLCQMQLEPHLSAGTSTGRIYLYGNQHTRKVRIGRPVQKVQIDKDCSFVYATAENRLYHIPTDHFSEGDVFGYIPQDACISDFCIHPVRPELYTASGDGKILLYDLRSSLAYHTWNHTLGIASIGFIPTKKLIITGDISGNIQFWCQESGRRLFENLVYPSPITTISVFPDETFFCVGTYSGDMATWSLGMCRVLSLLLPSDPIKRCILHERSRGMVAASSREIAVWEPAGMEKRISHPVEKELTCFKVSNLNPRAFAGFEDGSIAAIRLDSGLHKPFLDSLRGAIRCIGIYGL